MAVPVHGLVIDVSRTSSLLQAGVHGYSGTHRGEVAQSYNLNNTTGDLYLCAVTSNEVPIPTGYANHATHGDLTITRFSMSAGVWVQQDWMYLEGFGHGIEFGVDASTNPDTLWIETNANYQNWDAKDAFGNAITSVPYVGGTTVTAISGLHMFPQGEDQSTTNTHLSCCVRKDTTPATLVVRWEASTGSVYQAFNLADAQANNFSAPLLTPARTEPDGISSPVTSTVLQGWTYNGQYVYALSGYGKPTEPGYPPNNVNLTSFDLNAAFNDPYIEQYTNAADPSATPREPEGVFLNLIGSNDLLCYGISNYTSAHETVDLYKK